MEGGGRVFSSMRAAFVLLYLVLCLCNPDFAAGLISLCSFLARPHKVRVRADAEIDTFGVSTRS